MAEFGIELRKERESRGIGLETISDVTKISTRHLTALESENFDQLPGGVFNKGIVRGYARVVGLDESAWIDRFMTAYQGSGQLKDDDARWIEFAENVSKGRENEAMRPDMRLRWAGVAVLLTLLAALSWFVYNYVSQKVSAQSTSHQSLTGIRPVAALAAERMEQPSSSL